MDLADTTTMALWLYASMLAGTRMRWVVIRRHTACGVFHVVALHVTP